MSRQQIVSQIEESGIVAVVRLDSDKHIFSIIDALLKGGVGAMEITMTTPNARRIIADLNQRYKDEFLVGAGTVLDAETTRSVVEAGARFVVSPVFDKEVIRAAHRYDVAVFPGAFSPTEILNAWENGADVVKVFPATVLGPKYFRDIHGPLPQVKLTPTGGVDLSNAAEFVRAGACCLGVGSSLLDRKIIENEDWQGLAFRARQFVGEIERARNAA